MATFNNFSVVVICFMVSSALIIKIGLSRDVPELSNAPKPSSSYLTNCAKLLGPSCGKEVFSAIVFGNETVSSECCDTLVSDVGKECHDEMTKYILTLKKSPKNIEHQILRRSQIVWNDCVLHGYPALEPIGQLNEENLLY